MPYFKWKGIDWYGNMYKGIHFARSAFELEKNLLDNEIGLTSFQLVSHASFLRPIPLSLKVQFFKELSILVDSGVLLHTAIDIIDMQITHAGFKRIIEEIKFEVNEGSTLAHAMEKYPGTFDVVIVQMVSAGEESGKLSESLIALSEYLERYEIFIRKLRSIILLPCITLILFLIIMLIIFIVVIPSFSSIFLTMNQEIPRITQTLLNISTFLRGSGSLILLFALCLNFIIIYKFTKSKMGKSFFDNLFLKIPFINKLIRFANLTYFLQSTSLLLNGGVNLVDSLSLSTNSINNIGLKNEFIKLSDLVKNGNSLSDSMKSLNSNIFQADLNELVKIGEESGHLSLILNKASLFYYEKLNRSLALFLTFFQPILMIILGVLVALLIFAVYLPIFNLPNLI